VSGDIRKSGVLILAAIAVTSWQSTTIAQVADRPKPPDDDHAVVFEIGAAGDWSSEEGANTGGTFAFEVTPVEHWLELEVGITAIRHRDGTEWPLDVLFKKPWRISRTFEFMIGIGPEVIHETGADAGTFWGLSSVLDFMFWPRKNVGWYVEPGYELVRRDGISHHGVGVAVGLLIGR
jgi:hypothetical protein